MNIICLASEGSEFHTYVPGKVMVLFPCMIGGDLRQMEAISGKQLLSYSDAGGRMESLILTGSQELSWF